VLALPALAGLSKDAGVYFLDVRLHDAAGATVARSFYWLPREEDALDPAKDEKTDWYVTRTTRYADLTAVARLASVDLEVSHRFEPATLPSPDGAPTEGRAVHVTLHNPSNRIAFFVELSVVGDRSARLAAPIYWDDNYVSLLPGERREVRGVLPVHALGGEQPVFRYRGMNIESEPAAGIASPSSRSRR
jgi:exo-1,4-beta-D-glucosaminidase